MAGIIRNCLLSQVLVGTDQLILLKEKLCPFVASDRRRETGEE